MKNLVLATLICGGVAQLGTGCIIVGDDDGNNPPPPPPPDANEPPPDAEPPPGPGEFAVTWTLLAGEPQAEVSCPPDGIDIRITADPDPSVEDDEDIYLYDCPVGEGLADGLPPGVYDVWVELLDADGGLVAVSDIEEGLALDFEEQIPLDFVFSVDHARFIISWEIFDQGAPSDCTGVGAEDVSLLLTVAGSTEADDFIFSCAAGQGESDPMPIADAYVGDVSLLDSTGDVLDSTPADNLTLEYGNQRKDLGTYTFDVP